MTRLIEVIHLLHPNPKTAKLLKGYPSMRYPEEILQNELIALELMNMISNETNKYKLPDVSARLNTLCDTLDTVNVDLDTAQILFDTFYTEEMVKVKPKKYKRKKMANHHKGSVLVGSDFKSYFRGGGTLSAIRKHIKFHGDVRLGEELENYLVKS